MKKTILLVVSLLLAVWLQAQVTHTADVPTAGTLSTVASSYLGTVTNLTVTGTIDARDFKTMRDNMPLLAVLDLSGVTIAAYTGPDGTHPSGGLYPENEIPGRAFYKKTSLTSFTYPSSVTSIGISAFEDCSGLTGELTIPNSVTSIGGAAFRGCSGFTGQLTLPTSIVTLKDYVFSGCSGLTGELTIPNSVTSIGGAAFRGCSGFTGQLTLPTSIVTLKDYVFRGCSGLTGDLTIPSTVTSIGEQSFYGCSGFTGNLTIPSSVTSIGDIAFGYCTGFTGNLTIPSSVESIGQGAFTNCTGLTGGLTIPPLITTIYDYTFYNCYSLTGDLIIPSSVTSIGSNAFRGCTGFTGELTIPSSVTSIGENVFRGCSALTSIVSLATTPVDLSASSGVFNYVDKTSCTLYVPIGSAALYRAANQWQDFTHIIEGDGFWLWATEANIEKEANSTASIAVHSGVTWTATSNQAWLAVSPSSSSDRDATLTLTAQGNTGIERTATVTVSAAGVANQTIAVNQDGIKEQLLTIASVGNGTVTASPSSAIAAGMEITLSITPNVGYQLKEGSLNAHKTGDETTTVTITNGKFTMPQFDVTLNAEFVVNSLNVTVNGTDNVSGTSLENALTGINLATIASLEITGGAFNTADWQWLRTKKGNFTALTHFTITDGIGSVASIPDDFDGIAHFNNALQEVSVAKVAAIGILAFSNCTSLSTANFPQAISIGGGAFNECISLGTANFPQATSIGEQAFHACTYLTSTNFPQVTSIDLTAFALCSSLSTAGFPQATSIGELAFAGCTSLSTLTLGATPPSVGPKAFLNCPETRSLIWVDAEGNNLTGGALTNAGIAYKAVEDGDITDDLWYNWAFAQTLYRVTVNAENGHIVPSFAAAPSGTEVSLMVAPNVGYKLIDRTLEAHKTGDAATNVAITDGTFIMPEYDVTVTAQFELNTLNITINSTTNLSGNTLQNALGNADLSTITSLEVTGGGVFHTADWHWLKANRDKLSALTRFTISGGVGSVANIPSSFREPYFNTALQEVSVAKVERIGESTFQDCADLTTANFPQATSIGGYAFEHCSSLSTANFPQATSIGNYAFYNCTSLTTLSLGATPPWVGSYAFYGCPETRYLILADAEGNMLTGDALTTARNAYKNADDITDDLWEGWNFAETLYWITPGSARNGSLASSYAAAASQTEVRLTLTPNEGYKPKAGALAYHKTDDMATSVPISNDRFTMPAYNVTVTAQFEGLPQTLTLATAQNGSIISSPSTDIVTNTEITLSTLPQTGYHFKEGSFKAHKTSDESIPVAITNGTFTMPAYGVTATAEFEINTYDLTYTAGANGRLTGETNQTATHGSDGTTVTAVANTGYHFVKWSDGSTVNPRTDANVMADVSVEAQFAINTYILTYTAGANGMLTGETTQTVNHGAGGAAVTAVANTGYHFVKWSDGSTVNPRTDANVMADVSVEAQFAINTYDLTYTAGANGSLEGETIQTVNYGSEGTAVTAVANNGYHFLQWSDGVTANPRADANVMGNVTVVAEFDLKSGINDASNDVLSLYPNPAKEQVYIKGLAEPAWVEVYSLTGAKLIAQLLQVDQPLELNGIKNGVYLVRIKGQTFKMVVNK